MRRIILAFFFFLLVVVGPIVVGSQRSYVPAPAAAPLSQVRLNAVVDRREHRFACGDAICAGVLYMPARDKPPVIVMAGGFAGTQDVALPAYATALAESGIAVFTFDYRYFGTSGGAPRQLVNPWHQLEDWQSAISHVSGLEEVDGRRVALLGASLGGGHALIAAHESDKVTGIIALVPLVDSSNEGTAASLDAMHTIRLLFTAWGDLWMAAFGFDPVVLPALARKGEFAMLSDDAAYAAFEALASQSQHYRNEVLARSIFTFDGYNPAAQAAALAKPLLVVASREDRFAPFDDAQRFAVEHKGTLHELKCDHFEVYQEPCAAEAKAAILDFTKALWPAAAP